jgi:hypothetical protein
MRHTKIIRHIVLIITGVLLLSGLTAFTAPAGHAAALTTQQKVDCWNTWSGQSVSNPTTASKFAKSKCNKKNGGNCAVPSSAGSTHPGGYDIIECNNPQKPGQAPGGGTSGGSGSVNLDGSSSKKYYCGASSNRIYTAINLGCVGKGNATVDLAFAIIRFLSAGVGLVVIASIVYGGIQYTMSRGDPQATAAAVDRIRNSLFALLLFIFAYAIINYIIPKGFLK